MGKQIYFTDEEITELMWIVPQFKYLHQDDWDEIGEKKEPGIVSKIINKITRENMRNYYDNKKMEYIKYGKF